MTKFPKQIETDRLILRQPCMELAEAMANFHPLSDMNDPKSPAYETPYETVEAAMASIRNFQASKFNLLFKYFYTTKENPDKILGEIAIMNLGKEVELFWQADKDAPREGYASEAAIGIKEMLISQEDKKITALIPHTNLRSQKLATRLGMVKIEELEGLMYPSSTWALPAPNSPIDAEANFAV